VAFKKLKGCDRSDMGLWANTVTCDNLIAEIKEYRDKELRELIRAPSEASGASVRAYDKVFALIEECRKMG
jgi:hypothetical protein